jgi:hypothetical protein
MRIVAVARPAGSGVPAATAAAAKTRNDILERCRLHGFSRPSHCSASDQFRWF